MLRRRVDDDLRLDLAETGGAEAVGELVEEIGAVGHDHSEFIVVVVHLECGWTVVSPLAVGGGRLDGRDIPTIAGA